MSDGTTELIKPAPVLGARWRRKRIRIDPEAHEIHFDLMEAKRLLHPHCAAADQSIYGRQLCDRQHLHFIQDLELIQVAMPRVDCQEFGARGDSEVPQPPVAMHSHWSPSPREHSGFLRLFEEIVPMTGARGCRITR